MLFRKTKWSALSVFLLFFPVFSWGKAPTPPTASEKAVQAIVKPFDQAVNQLWIKSKVAGVSVIIIDKNKILYQRYLGVRSVGHPEKIDGNTVFQLASVSKPLTATVIAAVMSQANAINLNWDTRIHSLDPHFTLGDPWVSEHLTIKDLLSHRSGLPDHAGDDLEDLGYDRAYILSHLQFLGLKNFRNDYAYTNFGFSEAAFAIANYKKVDFDTLAKQYLINPLGLKHTHTRYQDFLNEPNRASQHVIENQKLISLSPRNPDAQAPAGGFSASSLDLATWVQALLNYGYANNKKIIDSNLVDSLKVPLMNLGFGPYSFYGLGFGVEFQVHRDLILKHSGAFTLGTRTLIYLIPEKQIGIIVLSNSFPTGLPESIADTFLDLLYDQKISQDWSLLWDPRYQSLLENKKIPISKTQASERELETYVGTYSNPYFESIHFVIENHQLILIAGPKQMKFPLQWSKSDVFAMQTQGENRSGMQAISFQKDKTGKIQSVTIDAFNENHAGVFIKS